MKAFLFVILAASFFISCKTNKNCQNNPSASEKKGFIPYEVGSFWVYESTDKYIDTLKVISHEKTEKGIKVELNTEKWLIVSEDSVFVRCNTRGGGEFTMPLYIKIKDKAEYSTCLGDVVTQVNAQKLLGPQVINDVAYIDCTEYFIRPYTKVIVADRVGPVKFTYLDIDGTVKSERILKAFKIN
jgi:hypothetical protein